MSRSGAEEEEERREEIYRSMIKKENCSINGRDPRDV